MKGGAAQLAAYATEHVHPTTLPLTCLGYIAVGSTALPASPLLTFCCRYPAPAAAPQASAPKCRRRCR